MVAYIEKGDIFALQGIQGYAHGCNCAGAMGKGIALQFKQKYPDMYKEYKRKCSSNQFLLGEVYEFIDGDIHIYNLATQRSWKTRAEIDAIKVSLKRMLELAQTHEVHSIALPKIGAGLGGLNWEDVKNEIESVSKQFPDIDLYIVENYAPTL